MVFTKRKSCCKQTSKRRECVYLPARKRGRRGRGYRSAAEANRERLNIDQVFIFVWALDVLLFSIKATTFFFLRKIKGTTFVLLTRLRWSPPRRSWKKRTYEYANPRKFKEKIKFYFRSQNLGLFLFWHFRVCLAAFSNTKLYILNNITHIFTYFLFIRISKTLKLTYQTSLNF